jgi:benzoylformate decarboxylase
MAALVAELGLTDRHPQPALPPPVRTLRRTAPMSPDRVIRTLAELLPDGAVIVEEAPTHRDEIQEQLPVTTPASYFTCAAGGLGWALPASMGMALARPDRKVVALLGDGSCAYSVQALFTAARLALPLTVIVLDNGGYAAIRLLGQAIGADMPPEMTELSDCLDLVTVARGFHCAADRVTRGEQLRGALETALRSRRPYLLDIVLDDTGSDIYPDRHE